MLNQDEMRRIDRGYMVILLIWICMLVALAAYIVIANIIGGGFIVTEDEPDMAFEIVKYMLYAIGAIVLAVAYVIRRAIRNPRSLISRLMLLLNASSLAIVLSPGEKSVHSPVLHYANGIVTCLAFSSAVGIYGLIIFIIEADYLSLYLLVGVSAFAMVYFRPRKQELIAIAEQMKEGPSTPGR